ncbi:MAG: LTA synthase family protein [Lachnospiraceae bacterium]
MKGQEENEGSAVTSWKTRIKKRYKRWKRRQIKKKNDPEYQKKKRAAARFRKKLVRYLSHAWMFPIVFFYFELLLRIFGQTGIFKGFAYMLLFAVGTGFFCSAVVSLFPKKINRRLSIAILFGVGILFIVECLVRESWKMYMTLVAIVRGAGGVMTGFSSDLFRSIFTGIPVILLFLLPGILYVLLGKKKLPARRLKIPYTVLLFLCAFVLTGVGSFAASHLGAKDKYKSQFEFNKATETFGLLTSVKLSSKYAIFGNDAASQFAVETSAEAKKNSKKNKDYGENVSDVDFAKLSESESDETLKSMHQYVNSVAPSEKNEYTGLFKGKNLILICAEAFSDQVISKELTPTLYRLTHKGIYFSDFYQPSWGGSTSTGEYSYLTGLIPIDGVETIQETRDKLNYYTMGTQLMKEGYYSCAYHNGAYDFYSRQLTHKNLGYADFLGEGNGLEEIAGSWVGDSVMFDKTMDTYMNQQPFSIYYMTVSGHCVYKKDNAKVKENLDTVKKVLGDGLKDTTLYYYCYQLELEKALTVMVEKLEEAGIADDTVICMTSDHYPYGLEISKTFGNTEDFVTDLYGYKYKTPWEKDHNTWLLWSGCLENENKDMACEIKTPTYSIDITPTLMNLFGIEYDSRLLVGRDVFSDTPPLVIWNDYSWKTDKGTFNSATDEFKPNKGKKVDENYIESINNTVTNKIRFSDQILKTDYYKVVFGDSQ